MILQRMGGEVGDAPGDPELLRRKEELKGIILFGWNDKDCNFFFLHFKVKKNFSAMPFYTFIIRKIIQKKFLRIILLHLA